MAIGYLIEGPKLPTQLAGAWAIASGAELLLIGGLTVISHPILGATNWPVSTVCLYSSLGKTERTVVVAGGGTVQIIPR